MDVRAIVVIAAALVAVLLAAPSAGAAKRSVPQGFYGAMLDREAADAPEAALDAQFALMARSGVESTRAVFSWSDAQPTAGRQPDFGRLDSLVAAASAHGVQLLPVVIYAPRWARRDPTRGSSPPARAEDYAAFLRQLVGRYGPAGTLWAERPALPRRPLRTWQIWNEPELPYQWDVDRGDRGAYPGGYVDLLRAARSALKGADSRSRVVLAGLTNDSWNELRLLYRSGARRLFDIAAVQTYTGKPENVVRVLARVRAAMRRSRDSRKPVWITELGWPAARGRTSVPSYHRSIATSDRGMASRLTAAYGLAAKRRRSYRLGRLYWYTWASSYERGSIFNFAGLGDFDATGFHSKPALRAYVRSARRHQGCVKTSFGRCR